MGFGKVLGGFIPAYIRLTPQNIWGGFIPFIHSNTHGKISGWFHTVPYMPIPFNGGYNSRAMLLSHLDFKRRDAAFPKRVAASAVCVRNVFPHVRESHGRKTS